MIERNKLVEELYRDYYASIKHNAWKVTNDEGLAEDFVQEFFVWLLQHLDNFDPKRGTFKSWFYAQQHFFLKKSKYRHNTNLIPDTDVDLTYPDKDNTTYTDMFVGRSGILTPQSRSVIVSYLVDGKTFKEIGSELGGISRQGIEQIYKAALKKIKRSLEVK